MSAAGMQDVLSDLSRLSATHLAELAADLTQTNDLLNAAIVHLMGEFDGLNQTIAEQQALLAASPMDCKAKLAALAEEVQRRVHGMVTGLQFEDMTKQLIGRSQARVAGLAGMLAAVDEPGQACPQLQEHLRQSSSALFQSLQKSVPQQRMEGGDVELF
jgi:type I site-specific restriction endonuclease